MRITLTIIMTLAAAALSGCGSTGGIFGAEPNPSETAVAGAAQAAQPTNYRSPEIQIHNGAPAESMVDTSHWRVIQYDVESQADAAEARDQNGHKRAWEATILTGKDHELSAIEVETGCSGIDTERVRCGYLKRIGVGNAAGKATGDRQPVVQSQTEREGRRQDTAGQLLERGPDNQRAVDEGDRVNRLIDRGADAANPLPERP